MQLNAQRINFSVLTTEHMDIAKSEREDVCYVSGLQLMGAQHCAEICGSSLTFGYCKLCKKADTGDILLALPYLHLIHTCFVHHLDLIQATKIQSYLCVVVMLIASIFVLMNTSGTTIFLLMTKIAKLASCIPFSVDVNEELVMQGQICLEKGNKLCGCPGA